MREQPNQPGKTVRVAVLLFVLAALIAGGIVLAYGLVDRIQSRRDIQPAETLADRQLRGEVPAEPKARRPVSPSPEPGRNPLPEPRPDPQAGSQRAAVPDSAQYEPLILVTESGRHKFAIEVADTDEKKQVGLMFRTSLDDGKGMLFPYERAQQITMWMRNTYISLDMVFIGGDGRVVRVARNTEPMSENIIASGELATGVLELRAGAAEQYGITEGSRVIHRHFKDGQK